MGGDVGGKLGRAEWEGGRGGRGGEASGGYAASRAHAGILKELFLFVCFSSTPALKYMRL